MDAHEHAWDLMYRTQGRYVALLVMLLIVFALTPFIAIIIARLVALEISNRMQGRS